MRRRHGWPRELPSMTYRTNAKCQRISWCAKPAGHDGWHRGVSREICKGMSETRVMPLNATEPYVIEATEVGLSEEWKRALSIGGPLPSGRQSWQRRMVDRIHAALRSFASVFG